MLQSFIANKPIFQISKVSREAWIILKEIWKNKQTNNIEWVKQNLIRGDCGLWTISLLLWALDVYVYIYGDHSKWSEGGKLLNLGACSKDRWTLGRGD